MYFDRSLGVFLLSARRGMDGLAWPEDPGTRAGIAACLSQIRDGMKMARLATSRMRGLMPTEEHRLSALEGFFGVQEADFAKLFEALGDGD